MDLNFQKRFDKDWQRQLLCVVSRSRTAASQILPSLKIEYFEQHHDRLVGRLLSDYYEQYHDVPTKADLNARAQQEILEGKIPESDGRAVLNLIEKVYGEIVSGATIQSTTDGYLGFARQQQMRIAILRSADLLAEYDYEACEDEIRKHFDEVALLGRDPLSLGIDFYDYPKVLLDGIGAEDEQFCVANRYPQINQAVGGGFGRGCIYIFMAPPGFGKSTTLTNLGSSFLWGGYNVLHVTLEMSDQKTANRYGNRLLNRTDWYGDDGTKDKVEALNKRLSHLRSVSGIFQNAGGLLIKEFPTRSLTVSGLKAHMMLCEANGFTTDVLVVDYADLMQVKDREKRYEELEELYERLRGLGQEMNCTVLSASQTNRAGATKYRPSMDDIAGSFGKFGAADAIIGLCRTKKERIAGLSRMYVLKSREADYPNAIWLKTDFSKCWLSELAEVEIPQEFLAKEKGKEEKEVE